MHSKTQTQPQTQFRGRQRSRFRLETQETQWSTHLNDENSFQPSSSSAQNEARSGAANQVISGEEPDIVTAGPLNEQEVRRLTLSLHACSWLTKKVAF